MSDSEVAAPRQSRWERWSRLAWPGHPSTWREVPGRLLPTLLTTARLTAASVVAYLFTIALTNGAVDLTGALTALLVVQASAYSTLRMGIIRVGAVLGGVLVATLLSTWIGLTWWSLGAAIASSLLLAKVLRLGEQSIETAISAMLILGVSNHDVAGEIRVITTLIGAGVGIAFNLIYPPAMPIGRAERALLRVADAGADSLDAAGDAFVAGPVNQVQVESWLERARTANRRVTVATDTISLLRDSRRLNPRALGTVDVEPVLATGLETLEHCLLAIRALFAVLRAEIPEQDEQGSDQPDESQPDGSRPNAELTEDPYGEELRMAFAVVLHDVGDCLRAFGSLVVAEADGREEETERALADSLDILRETQAILTELIMTEAADHTSSWLLRGSIMAAVQQVLARLNLEDRERVHRAWKNDQESRPLAQLPSFITGVLPHPERPYLRGLEPTMARLMPPRPKDPPEGPPAADD